MKTYIIKKITDHGGNTRKDSKDIKRVGRRVSFYTNPREGRSMLIDYMPRDGESYTGLLRTSHVEEIAQVPNGLKVKTIDSVYCFEEAAG